MSDETSNLTALRVAQSELVSGNTSGQVFVQLSPGAAMFRTDRTVAQDMVASKIQQAIVAEPPSSSREKEDSRATASTRTVR